MLRIENPGAFGGRREGGEGIAMVESQLALAYDGRARLELRALRRAHGGADRDPDGRGVAGGEHMSGDERDDEDERDDDDDERDDRADADRASGAKLRVVVADDELVARKRVARLLGAMPDVEVIAECASGEEVLARARADAPDVVVLDIQMPGLSGIDTKALLAADGPYVIFVTAHPEHAIEAFDVGAVDYVLKPVDAARLTKAVERARRMRVGSGARARDEAAQAPARERAGTGALERLAIATRKGIVLVDPADVGHAVLDGQLVAVHTRAGVLLTDTSLNDLADRLPADTFERVHRRAILNLATVERLEPLPTGGLLAHTRFGGAVEISRQAARRLRRRLRVG